MKQDGPIVIMGFGRSGTTWVSDIVSKSLGKIILFEPFHPAVFEYADYFCYRTVDTPKWSEILKEHTKAAVSKKLKNRWLLRNHLNSPLEEISEDHLDYVWSNVSVAGLKTIRQNFNIEWWHNEMGARILFVIRHPLAVISSITQRSRFFYEFGWDFHWTHFLNRTLGDLEFAQKVKYIAQGCDLYEQKIAFMWSVTHIAALNSTNWLGIIPIYYEDLYSDPFGGASECLKLIGEEKTIHPSYLFTPSMLTMKTAHPFLSAGSYQKLPKAFWKDRLKSQEINRINEVIQELMQHDERFNRMMIERNYIYRP